MSKLIYIGPSLSRGRLKRFTIFEGGYPTHLNAEFEACPQLKRLFVLVEDLDESLRKVQTKGTPLFKYFQLAQEV